MKTAVLSVIFFAMATSTFAQTKPSNANRFGQEKNKVKLSDYYEKTPPELTPKLFGSEKLGDITTATLVDALLLGATWTYGEMFFGPNRAEYTDYLAKRYSNELAPWISDKAIVKKITDKENELQKASAEKSAIETKIIATEKAYRKTIPDARYEVEMNSYLGLKVQDDINALNQHKSDLLKLNSELITKKDMVGKLQNELNTLELQFENAKKIVLIEKVFPKGIVGVAETEKERLAYTSLFSKIKKLRFGKTVVRGIQIIVVADLVAHTIGVINGHYAKNFFPTIAFTQFAWDKAFGKGKSQFFEPYYPKNVPDAPEYPNIGDPAGHLPEDYQGGLLEP